MRADSNTAAEVSPGQEPNESLTPSEECSRVSRGLVKGGFAGGVDAVGEVGEYAFAVMPKAAATQRHETETPEGNRTPQKSA